MNGTTIAFIVDAIPSVLKSLPNWVITGPDKVPYHPGKLTRADPTDPGDWGTFDQAAAAARRPGFGRVGFCLIRQRRIVALDLDKCRNPATGAIERWAQEIIDELDSYTEASPSSTGVRVLVFGDLPPGRRKIGNIECYDGDRYVSITGNVIGGRTRIEDRAAELLAWHGRTFPAPPPRPKTATCGFDAVSASPDDRDVIDRCRRSAKFDRLVAGDLTDYADDWSAADLGLLDMLVRAGANTADQLDRLHRQSGLTRPKWDERRGAQTYGERTIARALDGTVVPFAPSPLRTPQLAESVPLAATGTEDATAALPDDVAALKAMIADLTRRLDAAEHRAADAEQRAERLSNLQSKSMAVSRNNRFGSERQTGTAIAFEIANQLSRDPDRTEFVIPAVRLAEQTGLSEHTVGVHTKERLPEVLDPTTGEIVTLYERRVRHVRGPADPTTGRPGELKSQTTYVPKMDPFAMLEILAVAAPASGKKKNGHGGRPDRAGVCPEHPRAGVVRRITYHCETCDRELGTEPDEPITEARGAQSPTTDDVMVNEHHGHSVPDDGARPSAQHRPPPSVVNHYRVKDASVCHNDVDQTEAPVTAAWLAGLDLSPSPSDRHTS